MNTGGAALTIISVIVAIGSLLGFLAGSHHKMDLEQWTVGGRGFGQILVWLLMAGEIYTTFTGRQSLLFYSCAALVNAELSVPDLRRYTSLMWVAMYH